jgi:hypothetical protein
MGFIRLYETLYVWEVHLDGHYSHALFPEEMGDFIATHKNTFDITIHRMVA